MRRIVCLVENGKAIIYDGFFKFEGQDGEKSTGVTTDPYRPN